MTDPTMTTNAPLHEVRGLVEERGRYEGWLAALESRRDATPAHVLDRVRRDYDERLRRVLDTLASHGDALRAEESALSARHDAEVRALDERRDLLAEVELRTLVGEFTAEESESRRREAESAIGELESKVGAAAGQLADVRGLLEHVERRPANDSAAADPPADAASGAASVGDAPPPLPTESTRGGVGDTDVRGYQPDHFAPGLRTPSAPSFAGQGAADAAMAGNFAVPGAAVGQEKTLRCGECGAMNYPTEWYCEKCGAELATL